MAKNTDNVAGAIALIIIPLALLGIALFPLYLLYLLYKTQADVLLVKDERRKNKEEINTTQNNGQLSISGFWLSIKEVRKYKVLQAELKQLSTLLQNCELKRKEAGISRNKDGSISKRRNLGKKLYQVETTNKRKVYFLSKDIKMIEAIPFNKWKTVRDYFDKIIDTERSIIFLDERVSIRLKAIKMALMVWGASLLLAFPVKLISYSGMNFNDFIMFTFVAIGAISALSYYGIEKFTNPKSKLVVKATVINKLLPDTPPNVTIDTVDLFVGKRNRLLSNSVDKKIKNSPSKQIFPLLESAI